jgi:hypothetical protein
MNASAKHSEGKRARPAGKKEASPAPRPIYIVDGARTPFLKAKNAPGPFTASDLATAAGSALLMRQPFAPDQLDEVILGCASPSPDEVNIGRVVALRLGCGNKVPGWTVMRNCASGMQAIDSAIANLQCGRSQLVLAGGVDALSHAPLLFSEKMVRWLAGWYAARSTGDRLAMLKSIRLGHLAPVADQAHGRAVGGEARGDHRGEGMVVLELRHAVGAGGAGLVQEMPHVDGHRRRLGGGGEGGQGREKASFHRGGLLSLNIGQPSAGLESSIARLFAKGRGRGILFP